MKKLTIFILLIALLVVCACKPGGQTSEPDIIAVLEVDEPLETASIIGEEIPELAGMSVVLVTEAQGIDDGGVYASIWQGLSDMSNLLSIKPEYIGTESQDSIGTQITEAASGAKLVVGTGEAFAREAQKTAKDFPDTVFVCLNYGFETGKAPDNVIGVAFKEREAAYLTGLIAGFTTQGGKVGCVGGIEKDSRGKRYLSGFEAGVKQAKPEAQVTTKYCGAINDAGKSKTAVQELVTGGCDVLFCDINVNMENAVAAAVESRVWIIGSGGDWSELSREYVLSSACIFYDKAVLKALADYKSGLLVGGQNVSWGVAEGVVGIAESSKLNVENNVLDEIKQIEERIKLGEIKVN